MKESDQAVRWLNELKSCGVRLAVDDFGTGYSSLSYLKSFPVDFLKIDRAFVSDLPDDNEDVSLVTAILAMADSLGIRVVAEGVETDEQRQFLQVCLRPRDRFWGLGCPKIYHEAEDTLGIPASQLIGRFDLFAGKNAVDAPDPRGGHALYI